jgi:hypothetical protein
LGAVREEWPREGVGLDVDHDHVATVAERQQRVSDARRRRAGGLHHNVDALGGDQDLRVLRDVGGTRSERVGDRTGGGTLFLETRLAQGPASPGLGQIGDRDHVHSRGGSGLGKEHGPELSGPDDTDADRFPVSYSVTQKGVQVHGLLRSCNLISHSRDGDVDMYPRKATNANLFFAIRAKLLTSSQR